MLAGSPKKDKLVRNPYSVPKKSPVAKSGGYGAIGSSFPSGGPEVSRFA